MNTFVDKYISPFFAVGNIIPDKIKTEEREKASDIPVSQNDDPSFRGLPGHGVQVQI